MCKPGSASSGGGAASTGLGLAVVVLGAVGAVSMAAAVISTFLTAVLVTLIGGPVPDLLLPADVDGSTVTELLLPADRQQALAASAGDVVTTR
jgi:hypothetical protein